ncbi:chitosanase [Catellatospora sp. NPDC049133]|uniref:chitosanase n=1 Tax=Catellatospora sp. NPDC049133 TaxID=3155499 RepID=UPI0033E9D92B
MRRNDRGVWMVGTAAGAVAGIAVLAVLVIPDAEQPTAPSGLAATATATVAPSPVQQKPSASVTAVASLRPSGTPSPRPAASTRPAARAGLDDPKLKDVAMQLVSSAENSSLNWRAQYRYLEDIGDGRGYTGGIIGFCSGTGDMLELVELYTRRKPSNALAGYLGALRRVNGSASHSGLDPGFPAAWAAAAGDKVFQQAQNEVRDAMYFDPAVARAESDGLRALGQFIYYDAIVMHGPGNDPVSFGGIRAAALKRARPPAQGGDETAYLNAFLDARVAAMRTESAHEDTSRVDTAQRVFLKAGNFDLALPLRWKVYGDAFSITG